MKVNYDTIAVKVTNNRVSFFMLVKFMWRILFFEKALVILNIFALAISVIFSIIFQLFYKDQEQVVIMFNFYFIFLGSILLFIMILRLCMVLWNNKVDDKTVMNLVVSNNSRTRIIMSFFICSVLNMMCTIFANSLIVLLPELLVRLTITSVLAYNVLVLSLYMMFISFLLIWFFTTAMLFINKSVALMLSVLIMTLQLISAVPQKFHEIKEESIFLPFSDGTTMSVSRIRNVIDLQANIGRGNIRYPNLSRYISENFIEDNLRRGNSFNNEASMRSRRELWTSLGIMDENADAKLITLTGQGASQLPSGWTSGSNAWSTQTAELELNIWFKDEFISASELDNHILTISGSENEDVILEFYEFTQYIQSFFASTHNFQRNYIDWFDTFFEVENSCQNSTSGENVGLCVDGTDETYSYIANVEPDTTDDEGNVVEGRRTKRSFNTENLINVYQNYFFSIYGGIILNNGTDNVEANKALDNFISVELFNPIRLAARILENYFIDSTHDFLTITNKNVHDGANTSNPIVTNSAVYRSWRRSAFFDSLFYLLNPVCWLQSAYTNFAKEASSEIWFNWQNRSNISFTEQNNLFLTYLRYNIVLDENDEIMADTYTNVYPIWVFMLVLISIILISAAISIYRFNRMDLS